MVGTMNEKDDTHNDWWVEYQTTADDEEERVKDLYGYYLIFDDDDVDGDEDYGDFLLFKYF
jgi:hypothetical protein